MGFRFQKRIKIAPGLKINLSKSGASLSVGGKGATVNLSNRGVVSTLGIPGTGVSLRTNHSAGGRGAPRKRRSSPQRVPRQQPYVDQEQVARQRQQEIEKRKQESLKKIKNHEDLIANILNGWREQILFMGKTEYENAAEIRPYKSSEPKPKMASERQIRSELRKEIEKKFLNREPIPKAFYLVGVVVVLVISMLVPLAFSSAFMGWVSAFILFVSLCTVAMFAIRTWWLSYDKNAIDRYLEKFLPAKRVAKKNELQRQVVEYKQRIKHASDAWHRKELDRTAWVRRLLIGEQECVLEAVTSSIGDLDFPFSSGCDVFVSESGGEAFLNLDLPEIEDAIPEVELAAGTEGELVEKRRGARKRNSEYLELVSGLVTLVVATTFSAGPTIGTVTIAAYTQRGKSQKDTYVLHAKAERDQLPTDKELREINPNELLCQFGTQAKASSTGRLLMLTKPKWMA